MNNTKNINLNEWVTQAALAKELGVRVQCIHNWTKRGKIEFKVIEGSRLTLVNRNSIKTDQRKK